MTDVMDRRLTEAARRWQAEQPAPPAVPLDRLDERTARRPGWHTAVAAAAAVALVGGGAATAIRVAGTDHAGPSGSPSSRTPTPSERGVGRLVPWRAVPARHGPIGHRSHGRWVTPFDNLMANGEIRGRYRPGDVLRFTVYLESFTDVSLRPCPNFSVAIGAHVVDTWRLNCQQVPFRQASGRKRHDAHPSPGVTRLPAGTWHPFLPANRKVSFAMEVPVPNEPGRQKVLWTLQGPSSMPGFYGIIHIARP